MNYVLDASCLIYLGKLKLLEKLKELDGKKYIPELVYKEVVKKGLERGEPEASYIESLIKNKEFIIIKPKTLIEKVYPLSEADIEVISLAKETSSIPIIDEEYGRKIAEFYQLDYHGMIYLLLQLFNKKIILKKEIIFYLQEAIKLGFYISIELYEEILNKIKTRP